ncbi:MAG: hypothetical protein FD156_1180 [Nitrospirae bacterium]|nr:MAG: hypothetical protein FD156_1180 [Nitrospirota bacterium]
MTKLKKKSSTPETLSLFDYLKKVETLSSQTTQPVKGSLDIDAELRAAISEDIKHAVVSCTGRELSRYEVAAKMSELVGHEITKSQLDNWSAESHEKHRFPSQYLPAFVIATGGQRRTFEVLSRRSGLFALPGPEALRAEIHRIDEDIKRKKSEKFKREIFLKEIEGNGH